MKIVKKRNTLKENELYEGYITEVEEDKEYGRVRIYVELYGFAGEWFYVSLRLDEEGRVNSKLNQFFEEMGIFQIMESFDLQDLENMEVLVTLQKGNNGFFYVRQMYVRDLDNQEDYGEE